MWSAIVREDVTHIEKVEKAVHISMAVLQDGAPHGHHNDYEVSILFKGKRVLICRLINAKTVQCPLDLNFKAGDELTISMTRISSSNNYAAAVHLSGYFKDE